MSVLDFPPRAGETDDTRLNAWLDLLRNRQNIDSLIAITSIANGDEFYVFDASSNSTCKVTAANLAAYVGAIAGAGTVTSVALTAPDIFTVSGSPVTTTGTLDFTPTDPNADRIVFWDDSAGKWVYLSVGNGVSIAGTALSSFQYLQFAITDQSTAITTGTKFTTRFPDCTVLDVRTSVQTVSSSGAVTIDIQDDGTTIFSTKPSIDASEKTNLTGTAAVISAGSIGDDSEMTFIIDAAGTGAKGVIVTMKVMWS